MGAKVQYISIWTWTLLNDFIFYYNKSDITPTVLDRGNKIILADWPNDNILYVLLIMTYPLTFQVIHMYW